ncbi:hypothetical protein [Morganella psychrotolerans]|uniref:hypothetical protein n=1 Tax=Morganella psychrotolerans TaxID=368603 RepID=UPI0039AECDD0
MNKINKRLAELLLITGTILSPAAVIGATNYGTMTLKLSGEVDLAKTPNPATPHYLSGALTGTTSMSLPTAYNTTTATWLNVISIVGISGNNTSCQSGTSAFHAVPGTNKKGLELTYSTNPAVKAYVIPEFNYVGMAILDQSTGWTTNGSFFSPPRGNGAASLDGLNACIYPNGLSVPSTWTKQIMVSNAGSYPVYISRPVAPGLVHYTGTPLYITTEGIAEAAKGYLRVNISADINIMSTCQISNIINNNIDVTMGFSNEIIKESSLTFSCTGEGQQQVYFSAKVTEGTADTANPNRLLLTNITSPSVKNRPWVIGKTFMDDASPALTCNNANANDLIKFNNQEMTLPLKANLNQLYRLGIKWAICSDDTVPAGNYRGKTVINIYTKM